MPESESGKQRELDATLASLLEAIQSVGGTKRYAAYEKMECLGDRVAPLIPHLLVNLPEDFTAICQILGAIGPKATNAVPVLLEQWIVFLDSPPREDSGICFSGQGTSSVCKTIDGIGAGGSLVGDKLLGRLPTLCSWAWDGVASTLTRIGGNHAESAIDFFLQIAIKPPMCKRQQDACRGELGFDPDGIKMLYRMFAFQALETFGPLALPKLKSSAPKWFVTDSHLRDGFRDSIKHIEQAISSKKGM